MYKCAPLSIARYFLIASKLGLQEFRHNISYYHKYPQTSLESVRDVPFSPASTGSCLIFISEDGAESGVLSVDDAVSVDDWLFSLDGSLLKKILSIYVHIKVSVKPYF